MNAAVCCGCKAASTSWMAACLASAAVKRFLAMVGCPSLLAALLWLSCWAPWGGGGWWQSTLEHKLWLVLVLTHLAAEYSMSIA